MAGGARAAAWRSWRWTLEPVPERLTFARAGHLDHGAERIVGGIARQPGGLAHLRAERLDERLPHRVEGALRERIEPGEHGQGHAQIAPGRLVDKTPSGPSSPPA